MATGVLVIAQSGAGKSTSIEGLNPEETFIINVANKPLPFKGWKAKYPKRTKENPDGRMQSVATPAGILDAMKYISEGRPEIKVLVVDDWQYMSSFEFFNRASEKGYDKFTDIGAGITAVAKKVKDLRDDLIVYFLTHEEEGVDSRGNKKYKAKTIGKMVDEKLTLEGLFSIVLFGKLKKDDDGKVHYVFETQTDGETTCKSPRGMFADFEIPNDLGKVTQAILEYDK